MLVQIYFKSLIYGILMKKFKSARFVLHFLQFVVFLRENSEPGSEHEASYPK